MPLASRFGSGIERVRGALNCLLREGLTPDKIALTICLGGAVGVLPLLWGTTLLCVGLAARLGLNQAALQAVNYLFYPLQIALFFPFFRLGAKLLPWGPVVSQEAVQGALHGHFSAACAALGWATLKALGAWLMITPPCALLLYPLLLCFLRRKWRPAAAAE